MVRIHAMQLLDTERLMKNRFVRQSLLTPLPATNNRDQSSRSRLLKKCQLGFLFLRTKQCCIWFVTSTQEPRRCGQSPSRNFRKLQPLRPGPQCHSAPGAQYRARDTNLVRKPLATQNLTVPSTYSS